MVLRKLSQTLRVSLALMLAVFSTGVLPTATAYAVGPPTDVGPPIDLCLELPGPQSEPCPPQADTQTWEGNGPANPGCEAGQTAMFHWILTPGGNANIQSGTLTVNYSSGAPDTVSGTVQSGGAMHFNTEQAAPATVTSASAAYTFIGSQQNPQLVISDSTCTGTPTDVCPLIPGNQTNPADCIVIIDVCPNVDGIQVSPAQCDVCPYVEGIQLTPAECDVCPLVEGVQSDLAQCDVCPLVTGVQSSLSECDACPLVTGVQSNLSECDVCPNLAGTQSSTTECADSERVELCHATGNPDKYVFLSIDAEGAFNGHLGESHQGGRDIIPPFIYNGTEYSQNWDAEGQALYASEKCADAEIVIPAAVQFLNPTCENPTGRVVITATEGVVYKVGDTVVTGTVSYPGGTSVTVTAEASDESYVIDQEAATSWSHTFTATPTGCVLGDNDVCPNIEGTQTVVPTGMVQNTMTKDCFTPGRGQATPPAQVLGASTQALPAELPATGGEQNPLMIILASILAYGAAYFLQGRRNLARNQA